MLGLDVGVFEGCVVGLEEGDDVGYKVVGCKVGLGVGNVFEEEM